MANYKRKFDTAKRNIKGKIVMCSPKMADGFLERNVDNREVNQKNVDYLVEEILNGDWEANGQPLIFDVNSNLANGQNRCLAIVKGKTDVPVYIIEGVAEKARDTMDQHQIRSLGQVMDMDKITKKGTGRPMVAILKAVVAYDTLGFITDHLGKRYSPRSAKADIKK